MAFHSSTDNGRLNFFVILIAQSYNLKNYQESWNWLKHNTPVTQ